MTSLLSWFLNTGHKLAGIVIFATQLLVHWEDILDRFSSVLGLKKLIERRKKHMNILTLLTEGPTVLTDLLTAVAKIQADLPQFQKTAADLKQAAADKADPVKLNADITALLIDLQADMQDLAALIPQPPTTQNAGAPTV